MKIFKSPCYFSFALLGATFVPIMNLEAATVTWDNEDTASGFGVSANWVGDTAPVSGVDSIVITNAGNWVSFTEDFTIASGQSLTSTATGDYRIRGNGGTLTIATGGTLDFTEGTGIDGIEDSFGGGIFILIESGATAAVDRLDINRNITGDPNETVSFLASPSGVTTFDVANDLTINNATLNLDLSGLTSVGGTYELFDYGSLNGSFADVNVFESGGIGGGELDPSSYVIDYTHDFGGGDLGIAVTVSIPEPSALMLLIPGALCGCARRRR